MANFSKQLLTYSTGGRGISVLTTGILAAPTLITGSAIHSGVFGNTSVNEVYLYASNYYPTDANLILQWGIGPNNALTSGDCFVTPVPGQGGRVLVVDGRLLNSGLFIYALGSGVSAAASSGLVIDGYINLIS